MSYELTLSIVEDSPEGQKIEEVAKTQNISREEAAHKILSTPSPKGASAAARRILGAGREDAELIDEVMELVMSERLKQNAEPPRV